MPELVGPFLIPVFFAGTAGLVLFWKLRPDPYALADELATTTDSAVVGRPMSQILRQPRVVVALTAMIVGQVAMVGVMTMTPLHMTDNGHDLAAVGFVFSGHTAGMFAFSPVSGWISQRIGYVSTILLGVGVLAIACVMAALAPPEGRVVLFVALFLLGYGWNLGFVAGSALLTTGVAASERTRTEGFTDSLVWGTGAVASLGSGLVLAVAGFSALGIIAAALLVLPLLAVLSNRRAITATSGSAA